MLKKTLCAIGMFVLSACGTTEDTSTREQLKVGVPVEAVTMYPYGSNDNATARVLVNVFDRLIEKDDKGEFESGLATSWEMMSPTELKLTLRSNVTFHNGEPFSATDVEYSVSKMLVSSEIEHIASPIKGVTVIDPYTVIINLHEPFAPILSHMAHVTMSIINEKAIEEAGEDVDQYPVGTGAYKLKAWNRGQSIILERNEDYWAGPAKMKEIEFRIIPEPAARTIALETGDVDMAYDIDPVDRERVIDSPDLRLVEKPIARIEYLGFNIEKGKNPIWKDKRVREAVSYAIDIDGIIKSVLFGAATPADSIIYETVVGHYDGLTPRKRDIEKAKALLAEAGVPKGTKVSIWTTEGQRQKIIEVVQANLREIGIDASIEVYEWARFLDGTGKGEHDMFILGWTTVTGDADYGIYNLIHTKAFGGAGNRTFYSNPEIDRLLDEARGEIDPVARDKMYQTIQEVLYEDLPFIPFYYKLSNIGENKNVQGFKFDLSDAHRLQTVYLK